MIVALFFQTYTGLVFEPPRAAEEAGAVLPAVGRRRRRLQRGRHALHPPNVLLRRPSPPPTAAAATRRGGRGRLQHARLSNRLFFCFVFRLSLPVSVHRVRFRGWYESIRRRGRRIIHTISITGLYTVIVLLFWYLFNIQNLFVPR